MGINQPSSWTATTLGASADFINGYPFAHTDRGETGLPIIRIEQLKNRAAHCDRYSGRLPEQYKITDGDIVFSWSGSFFVDLWERGPAWLNQHLFKVIPVSHLDQTFFMHLLRWSIGELQQRSHGSTMSHITRKDINSFGLTLPPLSDQRRITEILDTLDAQIASQREVINKLKIIAAAIMDSHLTKIIRTADAEFSLATLADIASGVTLGTETGGSIELPYLRVANVQDGYIDTSEMKRVHVSRTDAKRYLLEAGDVLLTEGATWTNSVAVRYGMPGSIHAFAKITSFVSVATESACCPSISQHTVRHTMAKVTFSASQSRQRIWPALIQLS